MTPATAVTALIAAITGLTGLAALFSIPNWPSKLGQNHFSQNPYSFLDKVLLGFGAIGAAAFSVVLKSVATKSIVDGFTEMSYLAVSGLVCLLALRLRRVAS